MQLFRRIRHDFERTAVATAFAEQAEFETAQYYFYNGVEVNSKSYLKKIKQFFDRQQEAITFAQAGEADYAIDVLTDKEEIEERSAARLLVMGKGNNFSNEIIEYALEMAERMSYGILALNTASFSCETFNLFSSRNKVCEEFKTMAEENVASFKQAAEEKGIHLDHLIMFNKPEEALEIVAKKDNIAFVITDFIEDRLIDSAENRPTNRLFVYSMSA
jgi:hypothetical protein